MSRISGGSPPRNRVLAALPTSAYARLVPNLVRVELERRDVMCPYGERIAFVFFPETSVASMVRPLSDGSAVEVATIGNEGMVGLPLFLGDDAASAQIFCQVDGTALRMDAAVFRQESADGALHDVLGRYAHALLTQVAQTAVCNAVHTIRQRCARWLLHTNDRVENGELGLTQDFLAQMLGVRRATVTEIEAELQAAGFIETGYRRIRVIDRKGLEGAACECYGHIVRDFARLIERRRSPDPLKERSMEKGGHSLLRGPPSEREPPSDSATHANSQPDPRDS